MFRFLLHLLFCSITIKHYTICFYIKFVYMLNNSCAGMIFLSVPSNLITSASLSLSNPIGIVGSSVTMSCIAFLSVDVSGAMIEFDLRLNDVSLDTASGTTLTKTVTISPVALPSAGSYTCTVTVTAPGVCGGGGSEPACPTKNSDSVLLKVQCELQHDCLSNLFAICVESYLQLLQYSTFLISAVQITVQHIRALVFCACLCRITD